MLGDLFRGLWMCLVQSQRKLGSQRLIVAYRMFKEPGVIGIGVAGELKVNTTDVLV